MRVFLRAVPVDRLELYVRGMFVAALTQQRTLTSIQILFAFSKTWFCPES